MDSRRRRRSPRRWRRWVAGGLAVGLLAGAGVAWQTGLAEDWWDQVRGTDPDAPPAAVAPPPEVDVPEVVTPSALAEPADPAAQLRRGAVRRALGPLADADLGKHVLAAVAPVDGTAMTYEISGGAATAIPASTTKLVTSAVALSLLGPDATFSTTTVVDSTTPTPRLVLVGGGDPFLARAPEKKGADTATATYAPERADLRTLARRSAKALAAQGVTSVEVAFDDTLFSGPAVNPTWEADYVPDHVVSPISSLWVDEGRQPDSTMREADPAAAAAAVFAAALGKAGVTVVGAPTRAAAPAAATPVAEVSSATLAQVVQRVLEVSDNEASEVLLRHIGLADQGVGSFEAGQAAVTRVLEANGIALGESVLYDGSGLSRANRLTPQALVGVVRWAASDEHPELRPALTGLPVAGFTGSLSLRMDTGPAEGRGRVRAKTGTLTGVTSLAGLAVDRDGNLMAFALMADKVEKPKELLARTSMDRAAANLGACSCGR